MLYLDHAATTPIRPEVREAMAPFADESYGNPSGAHGVSRAAKNALEEARDRAAALLGAHPLEIVFTSGGTEADNLAVKGAVLSEGHRRGLVTSTVEHDAVLRSGDYLASLGRPVSRVPVDRLGRIAPEDVVAALDDHTALVSVMTANNETGVSLAVREVATGVKAADPDVLVHTDAVQAFVSDEMTVDGLDLVTLSAHKLGGPKGIGLLYVRSGVALQPVIHGGGQELGRRSGTHNVMGAVGMAVAMEGAVKDRDRFRADVGAARDLFEEKVLLAIPGSEINAPRDQRLVQHSHIRFPGIRNETLLARLDQRGLAASAASACQSGAARPSHVLLAMDFSPEEARECIRFSFGWTTRPDEGAAAAEIVIDAMEGLG